MALTFLRPMLLLIAVVATLAGCAARGPFPSLAPRPAERLSTEEPVRPALFIAPDPGLSGDIERLLAEARRGQREFEAALPAARAAAGRSGAVGSESWIEAQQALSRLEAARALTLTALAELNSLSAERATRATNAQQLQTLVAAVETAAAIAASQQAEIDRLRRAIRPS